MRTSEIRQRWLDYFASQGHEIRPSVSLVSPEPSILFTIAGMVPFSPYIPGVEPAPWPRAASVQKCIRTNDIDNVGRTTRHGTFFKMNGNFSFGDYFKEGAIHFAWDLLTGSQSEGKYGLDGDRMWVTIWEKDDEAFDVLTKEVGMDPRHIVRLPREENFWDTGQPGPAGPCCEWHYDRGPAYGPEAVGGNVDPGGDRYLELWNLVFDQYMRGEGSGKDYPLLGELDQKAIDTGAGLERLAFVMQDKPNMYEIDEVYPVIAAAEEMSGKQYGLGAAGPEAGAAYDDDVRLRVVADHVRSSLMLIGDGVRPGNDGRGYVLRRLIRRAVRSMRLLGVDTATMPTLLTASKDAMKASYPELEENWGTISEVAYAEEDAFRRTLTAGTTILDAAVEKAKAAPGAPMISGEAAFSLHDTYGFPIDLTLEMASEQGVHVDEAAFRALMEEQKEQYGLVYKSRPPYEVLYTKWLPYSDVLRLKRVEEMVEVYYNSRQFSYTLGALEKAFPDSFSMYEQLGAYYDEEGQTFLSHARVTRYEILYAFAKKIDPEREELYRELLIFDFYLRENAKSRPAFAGEETVKKEEQQQFYDEEAKAHKYLVGYEKWDKRQLRKMTHIERFGYRVTEDAARGETVLLFDYQNRNPL
ncbi:MAG: alanine--tRNA ligase, partial [Actinomyces sp. oral taxon 181]|uniref:alanine--tRNA ligase n=1 Tax=Actinomyces sp. oral taxon 181 TaxID=712121 RepID=UPI0025BEB731